MQAIILAAGRGRRLNELSVHTPKCLLDLGGRTILDRQIEILRDHGIGKIVLVGGYCYARIEEAVREVADLETRLNPFYETTNVLASMWFGKGLLTEDYIFLHGDTIFEEAVLARLLAAQGNLILAVDKKPCELENMRVKIENGNVVDISKEIPLNQSDGEFIGLARIGQSVREDLHQVVDKQMQTRKFDSFFEAALQDLLKQEAKKKILDYVDITGLFWEEIDFEEDYQRARAHYELKVSS